MTGTHWAVETWSPNETVIAALKIVNEYTRAVFVLLIKHITQFDFNV